MDNSQLSDFNKKWAQVVAKGWKDPSFKEKLFKNPEQVLKENGIEAPAGKSFELHDASEKKIYLTFPPKPSGEISEEQLKSTAAGQVTGCTTGHSWAI